MNRTVSILFLIPFAVCFDTAFFVADRIVGDGTNQFGIEIETMTGSGSVIHWSSIREMYVPPVGEMVVVPLLPGTAAVRCSITGPDLPVEIEGAALRIVPFVPELRARADGSNIVLDWNDHGCGCWFLETKRGIGDKWQPSATTVPATNAAAFFKLSRKL